MPHRERKKMMMSTYMYAWTTEDLVSSAGGIYVKVGVTDNLQARKNQTEQLKPLELLSVIGFGHEKKALYDNRFKNCHAHRRVDFGGGKEFFLFPSREYVVDMFKSIAIPEGVEFHSRDEFDAHWRHMGHVNADEDEVEVVVAPPSTPAPPPSSSLKRKRAHEPPFDDAMCIKKACVKDPQFYEKFLDYYGESPFPVHRYVSGGGASAMSGEGITFQDEVDGVPINKPPSYGENDILRDNPFDPSDEEGLLLWRREIKKVQRDPRFGKKNVTRGTGNVNALITAFRKIHATMS